MCHTSHEALAAAFHRQMSNLGRILVLGSQSRYIQNISRIYLGISGPSEPYLGVNIHVDPFWSILIHFDPFWAILSHFDPFWSILIHFDPFCQSSKGISWQSTLTVWQSRSLQCSATHRLARPHMAVVGSRTQRGSWHRSTSPPEHLSVRRCS